MNRFKLGQVELDIYVDIQDYLEDWQVERGIDYVLILALMKQQSKAGINKEKLVTCINDLLLKYLPNNNDITIDRDEIRIAIMQLKNKIEKEINLI